MLALPPIASGGGSRRAIALGATFAIHGLFGAGLLLAPAQGARVVERVPRPLHVIEMPAMPVVPVVEPPSIPAPEPAPPATAQPAVPPPVAARAPPAIRPAAAPAAPAVVAPAQTGQVVAAAPEADFLDFTDFDIAVGEGQAYAGGSSSSAGKNTVAARGDAVAVGGAVGSAAGGGKSQARSVGLPGGNWDCPWPDDARALRAREQEVRLRAVVRSDGSAAAVEILSDPGHGFGAAALRCARVARFEPALDDAGRPVEARSPAIRVRFTR